MKSLIFALSLTVALVPPAFAATPDPIEYKRADTNFYLKSDVLNAVPNAVIVPLDGYTQQGDSYFVTGRKRAPKVVYALVMNDWIEPITPPNATSLGVPSDAMQILDPHGDVEVAFPAAPTTFVPVQNGMTVANGSVVKTGTDGTAAVVFGSVCSARFIPNSEAAVQQNLTPGMRSTEIDLSTGAVFSKVGKPIGEKEDYTVHTPFGVAAARGTDFVSVALPTRTDVWIAEGTVQFSQTSGAMVGQVSADGAGALKIIRFPPMPDAHATMMAGAETMTAAMDFIPLVNQEVKNLHDRIAQGEKLSDSELHYLARIKRVPCLIKLTRITPPAQTESAPSTAPVPTPSPAEESITPTESSSQEKHKPKSTATPAPTPAVRVPDIAPATSIP